MGPGQFHGVHSPEDCHQLHHSRQVHGIHHLTLLFFKFSQIIRICLVCGSFRSWIGLAFVMHRSNFPVINPRYLHISLVHFTCHMTPPAVSESLRNQAVVPCEWWSWSGCVSSRVLCGCGSRLMSSHCCCVEDPVADKETVEHEKENSDLEAHQSAFVSSF